MPLLPGLAASMVLLAAGTALAQAKPPELRELETGFSVGSEIGALYFWELPSDAKATASGALLGVNLGGDLGPVRLGLLVWGQSLGADADYAGIGPSGDPHRARGDFQTMMLGLDLRVAVLTLRDAQDVPRTSLTLRALGGPTLSSPAGVLDGQGWMLGGGVGLLYHTRVRHFAVGIDALAVGHVLDAGTAAGVAVLPAVRYTF